jgi:hypothetical protein
MTGAGIRTKFGQESNKAVRGMEHSIQRTGGGPVGL